MVSQLIYGSYVNPPTPHLSQKNLQPILGINFKFPYAPITWQVDRKCHMISASSFDKMCFDMKMQRDDMSGDLHAHGSRELVHHDYSANNQYYGDRKQKKNLRA